MVSKFAIFLNGSAIIDGKDVTERYKHSQIFAKVKNKWSIYIRKTSNNTLKLVISCKSRIEAYYLFDLIKCFYTVIIRLLPFGIFDNDTQIIEFNKLPNDSWKQNDWMTNINERVHQIHSYEFELEQDLRSGLGIATYDELETLRKVLKTCFFDIRLIESFRHLYQSLLIFNGNMNYNYYHSHFKREREYMDVSVIEKSYLENREKYELSFTACFKAIERFLNVNDIKRGEVKRILNNSELPFTESSKLYNRYFEIFKGNKNSETQEEMIKHFLDIRNSVGAHANRKPPLDKVISFDSIYEIQHFMSLWLEKYIEGKIGLI